MEDSLVGRTLLGRYRVEALIGRGGMGEVYKAWDRKRSYYVALKLLREDLAEDRFFAERFQAEAATLARLSHRNIVTFYGLEQAGHLAFIVMEFVEGTTLRRRLHDLAGPLPLPEVLSICEQVCAALFYAHQEGLIHRDIKPGNIMLEPGGRALLSDFGIAKSIDAVASTHTTVGTPAYMAPEQWRGKGLSAQTDLYALGIVVYEMLTGRRPFLGDDPGLPGETVSDRVRYQHLHLPPPPPRQFNPDTPAPLQKVVLRALAKEPEDRQPDALADSVPPFVGEVGRLVS